MKFRKINWLALTAITGMFGASSLFGQDTLTYTGAMEIYTIPDGVTKVQIEVWGGQAEAVTVDDFEGSIGGLGGYSIGELVVSSGDVLNVYVGGEGETGAGGWNGGGTGGVATAGVDGTSGFGGSGGGASDVRVDGTDLADRIIVGAGGGGGGRDYVNGTCLPCGTGGNGGDGGATIGLDGDDPADAIYDIYYNVGAGASGGTDLAGGAGGTGTEGVAGLSGILGEGAVGINGNYGTAGGGGGGGYYGGGSGAAPGDGTGAAGGGGAGGSSYFDGVLDGLTTAGVREGNGMVVITFVCENPLVVSATITDETLGSDGAIDLDVSGGDGAYSFDWDTDELGDFDDDEDLTGLTAGTYIVSVTSGPACDTLTETIVVNSQVGIEESVNAELEMTVFPNPTQDFVTLNVTGAFEYSIHTASGQIITAGKGINVTEIDLNDYENGIYLVTVTTAQQNRTVRLIKK
ncbi:MAG: T9SS type A sorting domain-containing protein [Crocinitomix sp.]|nr:T9SS type A sorting domain-containing protein [Crocinitomix sp.]